MELSQLKKLLIAAWVGFFFAIGLAVRWHMVGSQEKLAGSDGQSSDEVAPIAETDESREGSRIRRVRQTGARIGEHVAIGVKSDVDRVRAMFRRGPQQVAELDNSDDQGAPQAAI
jgi:hypothetical protein